MRRRAAWLGQAAKDHDGSSPHILLPVDAELMNLGTVKHRGNERVDGSGGNAILLLRLYGERTKAQQWQTDAS